MHTLLLLEQNTKSKTKQMILNNGIISLDTRSLLLHNDNMADLQPKPLPWTTRILMNRFWIELEKVSYLRNEQLKLEIFEALTSETGLRIQEFVKAHPNPKDEFNPLIQFTTLKRILDKIPNEFVKQVFNTPITYKIIPPKLTATESFLLNKLDRLEELESLAQIFQPTEEDRVGYQRLFEHPSDETYIKIRRAANRFISILDAINRFSINHSDTAVAKFIDETIGIDDYEMMRQILVWATFWKQSNP